MSFNVTTECIGRKIYRYHIGSSTEHTGMREDIKNWFKQCTQCIACNVWRSRSSEMYFTWLITVPFLIMNVDLCSSGVNENIDGSKRCFMNSMCVISQFIVSSPTVDITVAHLAQLFAQMVYFYLVCAQWWSLTIGARLRMCLWICARCWFHLLGTFKRES